MSRVAWFGRTVGSGRGAYVRVAVAAALVVPALLSAPAQAVLVPVSAVRSGAPAVSVGRSVTVLASVPVKKIAVKDGTKTPYKATETKLPTASSGTAALAVAGARTLAGAKAVLAGTPLWAQAVAPSKGSYTGPSAVGAEVSSQAQAKKLGIAGVVFTVTGSGSGRVRIGLDYSAFAQAYGGNYGSRLVLVELPECALTTPQVAECRVQTPVASTNDAAGQTVSGLVSLDADSTVKGAVASTSSRPTVLAAMDSTGQEGGAAGSYAATALKPSGSWSAGDGNGAFTYSYPITVPGASSSLVPSVGLSYDSSEVDGQTSSTQTQSSWAGDGWSSQDSYIERTLIPCDDSPEGSASPDSTTDECYDGNILTLSLNDESTSLVYDSATGVFTPADDNGETITHVTGSGNGSGTYNTDYWIVTDRDGTKYEFGRNELPGWVSGDATTYSVDTEPVYSAHSGDPCYSSSGFTSSVCTMAYQWHLDYVVDTHGNAMAYYYSQATNYYGEDNGAADMPYVRDSYLAHIDYGFTTTSGAYGTVPDKVVFTPAVRCVSGATDCGTAETSGNASYYPDVPYDLECAVNIACGVDAPSFFSTVRLTTITTEQYSVSASQYETVDSYALAQTEPATGDGTSPTLWLSSITHTGDDTSAGGSSSAISLPSVTFGGTTMANRVNQSTYPGLYRYRLTSITTEMGSVTTVTYGLPTACTVAYVDSATPSSNTESCYPVYWTPSGDTSPILDWFEKYAVTQVLVADTTGGSPTQQDAYSYVGGAAWHYDDDEVVKPQYRTYGQFRGYGEVITYTGNGNDPRTESETTYYRGMDGDYLTPSTTRSVSLTDSQGGVHTDTDQLAGMPLETTGYLGSGGPVDDSTIYSYWVSGAAATRTRTGLPALTANMTAPAETWTRQALTDGGTTTWRETETDDTYDAAVSDANFGLLEYSYTHTVPTAAAYDQCTNYTYAAANATANIVGLVSLVEKDSVACSGFTEGSVSSAPSGFNTLGAATGVSRPAQVMAASETFYDDPSFSTAFPQTAAPTVGDVTMTRSASGYSSGFTWQTSKEVTYDSYGRASTSYDGDGNKSTITYTVNSVGLTTATAVTNAKSQTVTTTLDPTRGLALTNTDVNGVVTTDQYDALGRLTSVWLDSRATTATANQTYAYTVSDSSVSGVVSSKMNVSAALVPTVTIDDSLGRTRQTQTETPQGGRLISDTFYDSHGWVIKTNTDYWDSTTLPTLALVPVADNQVPDQDDYTFDGLGRAVEDQSEDDAVVKSTSYTVYSGDATTSIPPTGAVAETTVTDPLGRTSALLEYTAAPTLTIPSNTFTGIWYITAAAGTYTTTGYGYDGHGNQASITDTAGDTWTSTFNLLGQVTTKADPDAGNSIVTYDADGNVLSSTDERRDTVSYTYDALGRETAEYGATTAGQAPANELASWVYDGSASLYEVGQLVSATSYIGGTSGSAYTEATTGYNVFGESKGTTVTIPSSEGALAGAYTTTHTYATTTGLLAKDTYTAVDGLPAETVVHSYTSALDLPGEVGSYGGATDYSAYSQVLQQTLGNGTYGEAYVSDTYDAHTGDLTDQLVTRSLDTPADVDETAYIYDASGNITHQTETRLGSSSDTETQCYQYDALDQLTAAWSATDGCAVPPTSSSYSQVANTLGTNSAYWTSWTFNALGERTGQTQHSLSSGTADTVTSYAYNGNGAGQANTLTSTATTGGTAGSTSYAYDADGNATTRDTAGGSQTLTWNTAGQLATVTGASTGTSYVYDASGSVLLRKDTGTTTLYLPDEELVLNTSTNAVSGTRYYQLPGGGEAVRTGTGTNYGFALTDQHGTADLELDYTAQTPTWRQFDPYGNPRGTAVTWIDGHGFLDASQDATTGLTDIGAREYDPVTGTFISLDPVLESDDPLALNGYSYTDGNPVTQADPSGDFQVSSGGCVGTVQACAQENTAESNGADQGAGSTTATSGGTASGSGSHAGGSASAHGPSCTSSLSASWGCIAHAAGNVGRAVVAVAPDVGLGLAVVGGLVCIAATEGACAVVIGDASLLSAEGATVAAGACLSSVCGALAMSGGGSLLCQGDPECGGVFAGGDGVGAACGGLSFSPETQVVTASGAPVPIDTLRPGDTVESNNTSTGKNETETVEATLLNHDTDLYDLTVKTSHGLSVIDTTSNHPFWDKTTKKWVQAASLHPGDHLLTADGASATVIGGITPQVETGWMWDLTITNDHDFYVVAGDTPVLVHNSSCGVLPDGYSPNVTEDGLNHSFDRHAAQWFGGQPTRTANMTEWQGLIDRTAQSSQVVPWSSGGTQTYAYLSRIGGKSFTAQFDRSTGDLVTAFVPNNGQVSAMLNLLGK
jgi:RHS repeat-associated protein